MTSTALTKMMTQGEAEQYDKWIDSGLADVGGYLLEMQEREGWRVLGYDSWRVYVVKKFEKSQSRVYQLLDAAVTKRVLLEGSGTKDSTMVETPIPERHLRELAPLAKSDPDGARAVWQEVQEEAREEGVQVTAARVRARVTETTTTTRKRQQVLEAVPSQGQATLMWDRGVDALLQGWLTYPPEQLAQWLHGEPRAGARSFVRRLAEWLSIFRESLGDGDG